MAAAVESVPGKEQKPGRVGRSVFDPLLDDLKVVELGAQGAGDGSGGTGIFPGEHLGGAGGIVEGSGFEAVAGKKAPALGQCLGVGKHLPKVPVVSDIGGQQTVLHRDLYLSGHLQFRVGQKLVDLGDGTFQGVFHRHHPEVELAFFHAAEYIDEFEAGNIGATGNQAACPDLSVSAVFSLESDQGALLFLKAFAFIDDGLEEAAGERPFHQVQGHPLCPGQQVRLPIGVADAFFEFLGAQGKSHPLLEQNQQLAVDLVDFRSDFVQFHGGVLMRMPKMSKLPKMPKMTNARIRNPPAWFSRMPMGVDSDAGQLFEPVRSR